MADKPGLDIKVALFCGGRGSASIVRELLRWPNIKLTLLVNAYDDGLSTGALRDFIPGMLGPSDFRKNLSYLLDLFSTQQYALQRLIEYRLPRDIDSAAITAIRQFATTGSIDGVSAPLREILSQLDKTVNRSIGRLINKFFEYVDKSPAKFDYADCSFGNLIFAGAYLEAGNFNSAAKTLAQLLSSRADVVNVSQGESRSLVALKDDGTILQNEASIVGDQSPAHIRRLFFFDRAPRKEEISEIGDASVEAKERWLEERETTVMLSEEADRAIRDADIIVYGPGTQHSSLLPSYLIAASALKTASAQLKVFTVNLNIDNDIQSLACTGLVQLALDYLSDPENRNNSITHVLYNRQSNNRPQGIKIDQQTLEAKLYRQAQIIVSDFENPVDDRVHSGHNIVRTILELYQNKGQNSKSSPIDIYVDLLDRSMALEGLLQEFVEIDWENTFSDIRLHINGLDIPSAELPAYLHIKPVKYHQSFSEVSVLLEWLDNGDAEYLVTLTGDGEYRLRDVLLGINTLQNSVFGVVYGSRNQSRRQFRKSLNSAYGEGTFLFLLS
jgi:2-phospho-L-lactate transferase/gluconeogenesis factor (CofD/UPF0052 family)